MFNIFGKGNIRSRNITRKKFSSAQKEGVADGEKNLLQEAGERINYKEKKRQDQLARKLRFSSKVSGDCRITDVFSFVITVSSDGIWFSTIFVNSCGETIGQLVNLSPISDPEVSDETTEGFLVTHLGITIFDMIFNIRCDKYPILDVISNPCKCNPHFEFCQVLKGE